MSNSHINYLIFDYETGGLDPKKHACVELAMIAVRADNFEEIGRIDDVIIPYNRKGENIKYDLKDHIIQSIDKKESEESKKFKTEKNKMLEDFYDFTYTEGAMNTHGVTQEDIDTRGISIKELTNKVIELASAAKVSNFAKPILIGHNPDFDRGFLQQMFEVSGKSKEMPKVFAGSEDYYGNFQPHCFDTIDLAKMKWHKNEDEIARYSLEFCAQKAGIDLVGAHRAINDVLTTKELFLYMKQSIRQDGVKSGEKRFREDFKFEY